MSDRARGKLDMPWADIADALEAIRVLCARPAALTVETLDEALRIARGYGHHLHDSRIVAAALESGCSLPYSEDMRHGQVIDSITVRNPFAGHGKPY